VKNGLTLSVVGQNLLQDDLVGIHPLTPAPMIGPRQRFFMISLHFRLVEPTDIFVEQISTDAHLCRAPMGAHRIRSMILILRARMAAAPLHSGSLRQSTNTSLTTCLSDNLVSYPCSRFRLSQRANSLSDLALKPISFGHLSGNRVCSSSSRKTSFIALRVARDMKGREDCAQ